MGFSACLTFHKSPAKWHWWEGGPGGVEKTEKKKKKKKKARSLLNSKVESALEVENPAKPILGASNSTAASWENFKLFSLVSQTLHYWEPTFVPSILTRLSELLPHPESRISLAIYSASRY